MTYVSPYGRPRGLASRFLKMAHIMATDRGRWAGTGIIEDLKLAASILNRREWLETMRLSSDPEAQRFAAELLDDADELEAAEDAAAHVQGLPEEPDALDPTRTIERLDAEAVKGQQAMRQIRSLLEEQGVVDDATPTDDLPGILRALLS